MADEVEVSGSLIYDDDDIELDLVVDADLDDSAAAKAHKTTQTVGTSEEPVNLGDLSTVGWFMLKNLDPTNFIEVKAATGGAVVGKMYPGKQYGPVYLGSGMQAPYVIASTAACKMAIIAVGQ